MRFVFHVGIHKTGSTFLQSNLAANEDWLLSNGVFFANTRLPKLLIRQREVLRRANNPGRATPADDALLGVNARLRRETRGAGAKVMLLSEENRLGPPLYLEMRYGHLPAGFYPRAADNLRRLTWGIAPEELTILIGQREPDSWLRSLYYEGLTSLNVVDGFDEFCANVDLSSIDYADLERRVRAALPGVEVRVLDFALLKSDARAYFARFLEACGITKADFSFAPEPMRVAIDDARAEALLSLARQARDEGPTRRIAAARRRILQQGQAL